MNPKVSAGVLLFLLFLSLYAFTMTGRIRFGDEGERYLTAQSLVERHDLAIRIQPDLHRKIGVDGRNYSSYELGSIVPLIPFYALGSVLSGFFPFADHNWVEMFFAGLFNPFITALTVLLLFRFLRSLGSSPQSALLVSALFGFDTIAWPYAKAFEREPILTFLLLLSVYTAFKFQQSGKQTWLWVTGASLGFLVFAKLANVILLPFFALYLLFAIYAVQKKPALTKLVWHGLGLAIPIALLVGTQAICNQVRFGSLTDIGLAGTWGNPLSYFGLENVAVALGGMLFSLPKSIFVYSPPALLFLFVWFPFFKQRKPEALLIGALLAVSILFNAMNANWDQPSWWGPKYLVPLVPLFLLPIGLMLDQAKAGSKRVWLLLIAFTALVGLAVQVAAAFIDDREYLDVAGIGINLAGALDFLRHSAIDSLVVYFSPQGFPVQINPFGIVLILIIAWLGAWLVWRMRHDGIDQPASTRVGLGVVALVLLIEFTAFIIWIVAPYPQVLAAQANTKYVAANSFLADGRTCEAIAMYRLAIERGTMYQQQAVARLNQLDPQPRGTRVSSSDLLAEEEKSGSAFVEEDGTVSISGDGSFMASAAEGQDVIARGHANPIPVLPNTTYEVSGWIKTENIYGEGFGSVTVSEDDGAFRNIRATDIVLRDETGGWAQFHKTLTTLPTTRRLFVAAGLWKTFGTVWIDGLQIAQITSDNLPSAEIKPCN